MALLATLPAHRNPTGPGCGDGAGSACETEAGGGARQAVRRTDRAAGRRIGARRSRTIAVVRQAHVRWVRAGFVMVAAVGLVMVMSFVEGPSVRLRSPPWAVLMFLLWFGPAALYWLVARTLVGSVLIGLLVGPVPPVLLRAVIETESSTAAIGLFTVAMVLWAATIACLVVEAALNRFASRRDRGVGEPHPQAR